MRKGFDGLSGIVMSEMRRQPTDGSIYIFINRRRDRMKLLVWQSHGFLLYYKRLERGTFELPSHETNQRTLKLNQEILLLMIRGIKLKKVERKTRYKKSVNI
jgi:transposase